MQTKFRYFKILAAIGIPMILLNLYVNGWQAINIIIAGGIHELLKDFGVYTRTVRFFIEDPAKLYWVPHWLGPNWFIYPPPSILVFWIFGIIPEPWNLILWRFFNIVVYWTSIHLMMNIIIKKYNIILKRIDKIYLYIILFALGSFYLNINHGQVNIVVLFFAVLSLYYLLNDKILISGFFYSMGFWLKLYPAVIFPIYFRNKKTVITAVISLVLFIVLLPLVLNPLIPLVEYKYFFLELTPYLVNTPLDMSPCNQSLMCFLMHFRLPVETFGQYPLFNVLPWIKTVNSVVLAISLISVVLLFLKDRQRYLLWVFASLLVLSPVFSITGWESVYILAMPLILHTVLLIRNDKRSVKVLFGLLIIFIYLPKPSSSLIAQYTTSIPFALQMLFFFRYMFIGVFLVIYNYLKIRKQTK